jgi:hypothetical protein
MPDNRKICASLLTHTEFFAVMVTVWSEKIKAISDIYLPKKATDK